MYFVLTPLGAQAEDITDKVLITQSRLRFDRLSNTSYLDATLENTSTDNLNAPIWVIIDNISAPTVSISNAAGTTPEGKPYFVYSSLTPGQVSDAQTWMFANPDRARFTFTVAVEGTVESLDTPPVANNISPPAFNEDTESIVILSYSDVDSDSAASCSISNLTNVSVSTACSCSAGVCSVGILGSSNYNGAASFSYTVTANGTESNSATASFSILSVTDYYTLSGIVTADRNPVAQATISLTTGSNVSSTQSNQQGRFSFDNIPEGTAYQLSASKSGYSFTDASGVLANSDKSETISGSLDQSDGDDSQSPTPGRDGATVRGVVKSNQRTVAEARVSLVLLGEGGEYRRWTRTDENGAYQFANIPPGDYRLTAVKRGVVLNTSNVTLRDDRTDTELNLPVQQTASLPDALYAAWNENLNMLNILELSNKGLEPLVLRVSLWESDIQGQNTQQHKPVKLSIPIGEKLDIPLSQLTSEGYGKQGIVHIQSSHGFLEGGMSTYRLSESNSEEFDFSFHTPLSPALLGPSFVQYNTYHPAISASVDHVYNWLSLINIANSSVRFRLQYYDLGGALLGTRVVRVPAHGRVDIDGGHELAGPNNAGIIEILPFNDSTPYNAAIGRYAPGAFGNNFAYATSQNAAVGHSGPRHSFVTQHPNSRTYLEASNVTDNKTDMLLELYGASGELLDSSAITIKPKATIHVPLHETFAEFEAGSIKVEAARERAIVFQTMVYQYNENYTEVVEAQAANPLAGMFTKLSSSYNLYLGMANWLRLLNTSAQSIDVSLTLGEPPIESSLTLKPHSRIDIPIHELQVDRNSYGLLNIEADTANALSGELVRSTYNKNGKLNLLTTIPLR